MNALYTNLVQRNNFNYPPGGEQLMSILDIIGPTEKDMCTNALVYLGVSGDEIKAGLTVRTLKKFSLVAERNGLLYLPARSPEANPRGKMRLFLFLKFATGETLLHGAKAPADFSFSSNEVGGLVYEVSFFDETKSLEAAEYVEYRKMSAITKPIVVLQQRYKAVTGDDVQSLFDEKKEIVVCVMNEGKAPFFFEDGKQLK